MNPLEIAQSWADPRVYDIVQRKWETLPAATDKKGKKGKDKGSGGPKAKRPGSAPGDRKEGATQVDDGDDGGRDSV